MRTYFSQVQAMSERGFLDKDDAATMEDRLLMHEGKAQIYGTQAFANEKDENVIWPIENVEELEARRAAIGLPSMETYLKIAKDSTGITILWDKSLTLEEAVKEDKLKD